MPDFRSLYAIVRSGVVLPYCTLIQDRHILPFVAFSSSSSRSLYSHGDAARLEMGLSFGFPGYAGFCIAICDGRSVLCFLRCVLGVLNMDNHTLSQNCLLGMYMCNDVLTRSEYPCDGAQKQFSIHVSFTPTVPQKPHLLLLTCQSSVDVLHLYIRFSFSFIISNQILTLFGRSFTVQRKTWWGGPQRLEARVAISNTCDRSTTFVTHYQHCLGFSVCGRLLWFCAVGGVCAHSFPLRVKSRKVGADLLRVLSGIHAASLGPEMALRSNFSSSSLSLSPSKLC
jgi:hypothetical protein